MAFDLIIRNATLPDGRTGVDIAVTRDRIAAVEAHVTAEAGRTIDAGGLLVSPPFVDAHFHMDATLSLGRPRLNRSGTLHEGIALWGELKQMQTVEEIATRARKYCDLAIAQGTLAIRSHVDVSDDGLQGVEALLEVRRQIAPYLDLQLVAFPQDGLYRKPGSERNLLRALDLGVDVVGGIPHFERTTQDGTRSVKRLCEIAAERGLLIDLHCDETDDPMSRHIETLAAEAKCLDLSGRSTGSHLTSMHSMDNDYAAKLIALIAESGVAAIANPLINVMLQGRRDTYPKRRGMTRVRELRDAGVPVAFGSDCVMDPWYSLGQSDMLEVAAMGLHLGHLSSRDDMWWCFEAVTSNPARILGLTDYGIRPGAHADFVLLQATDPIEAIRLKATRLKVIRRGRVIAETPARKTRLLFGGTERVLDPTDNRPAGDDPKPQAGN